MSIAPLNRAWIVLALAGCEVHGEGRLAAAGPGEDSDESDGSSEDGVGTEDADDGAESSSGEDSSGDDGADTDATPAPPSGPEPYPAGRVHSPITAFVADALRTQAEAAEGGREDVFLKAGASSTVNANTLFCFDGGAVDLGAHTELEPTLAFFLAGDAAGQSSFARQSLAAESGHSASWVIDGDPSPLQAEIDAIDPRTALVHFGTNDMGLSGSYPDSLPGFHAAMTTAMHTLLDAGIVPIVFGITRRGDDDTAQRWVPTYNAVLRGLAQTHQVPFVDLYEAIDPLAGNGLGGDGLHLEAYEGGACVLDELGLEHGYNVRNLVALQALDRVTAVLVDDALALDDPAPARVGSGTADDPVVIDALPFADAGDTTRAAAEIDAYGCATTDEGGPERWYRLDLPAPTRVRFVVLDGEGVDVDVQVIDGTGDPDAGCIARDDRLLDLPLPAGTSYVAVDTWVSMGTPLPGPYLFVALECEPDDPNCAEL